MKANYMNGRERLQKKGYPVDENEKKEEIRGSEWERKWNSLSERMKRERLGEWRELLF